MEPSYLISAARMFPAWFKSLTIVHLLMGYIYLASGFIVSFLLLVGMVIWPFNKNLYRQYAFYLTYAQWSRKYNLTLLCFHQENMSVEWISPCTPLLYSRTGVCRGILIFLRFAQNIDCGSTLEPPRRGGSNVHPQSMFRNQNKKK